MDIVDELRAFVATARAGSFTAAADKLGVSNRLTSKYVAELEARLGVRLLQRTTRRVGLTPAGEDLLSRAPAVLDDLDALLGAAAEGSRGFAGIIRVSASSTFGEVYVAGMLGRFGADHPELTIDLRLSDRFVDLAADGIDLAFRVGRSDTLSIKARKLGDITAVLAASPEYLARNGTPAGPQDLAGHAFVIDTNRRGARHPIVRVDGSDVVLPMEGPLHVNSARAAAALSVAGHGIVFLPRFALADDLAAGRLVTVLEDTIAPRTAVSAVYLQGHTLPRKVRALIDFAAADIRTAGVL